MASPPKLNFVFSSNFADDLTTCFCFSYLYQPLFVYISTCSLIFRLPAQRDWSVVFCIRSLSSLFVAQQAKKRWKKKQIKESYIAACFTNERGSLLVCQIFRCFAYYLNKTKNFSSTFFHKTKRKQKKRKRRRVLDYQTVGRGLDS